MDDCKIFNLSPKVVDNTVELLRKEYENVFKDGSEKIKVYWGKVHDYLGMTLDFSMKYQVKISVCKYVEDLTLSWDKLHPEIDNEGFKIIKCKKRVSAAPENLFKIDEDAHKQDLIPVCLLLS